METNLYHSVKFTDGSLLANRIANLPIKKSFTFQVSMAASHDVSGIIRIGSRNIKASNWVIENQGSTISHIGLLNSIPIHFNAGDTLQVIFTVSELDKTNARGIDVRFIPVHIHLKERQLMLVSQSLFLGIFGFLCLFNLIMFFVTRWSIYYKYAFYIFSAILYLLYYFGLLQSVFPIVDYLSINIAYSLYSGVFILYFFFIRELGNYKATVPKAGFYLKVGILYKTGQMVLEILLYLLDVNIINLAIYRYSFMMFEIILMFLIIFYIIKAKNLRGRVVIIGSSILIVAAIAAQLDLGFDRAYILEVGILCELLLFSATLGYITKQFFEDKNRNQQLYLQQLNTSHEKEMLVREIHHRVKNNLQTISSLLNIKQRKLSDPAAISAIEDSKNRVQVMGLLHKSLYQNDNFREISIKPYLDQLMKMLVASHKTGTHVSAEVDVCDIKIVTDTAINMGLIINELVTNCLKYAAPLDSALKVMLQVYTQDESLHIKISDNGRSNGSIIPQEKAGFGWKLVQSLVEKTEGTITSHYDQGLIVSISIPIPNLKLM